MSLRDISGYFLEIFFFQPHLLNPKGIVLLPSSLATLLFKPLRLLGSSALCGPFTLVWLAAVLGCCPHGTRRALAGLGSCPAFIPVTFSTQHQALGTKNHRCSTGLSYCPVFRREGKGSSFWICSLSGYTNQNKLVACAPGMAFELWTWWPIYTTCRLL